MKIVDKSKARCAVVYPKDADGDMTQAVSELVRIVRIASGATLPLVVAGSRNDDGKGIRLIVNPALGRGRKKALPRCDIFRIASRGDTLEISGARGRAVAYGVYELLDMAVGARWYFPGALGEDIPPRADISVKKMEKTYRPSLDWRAIGRDIAGFSEKHKSENYPVSGGHAYEKLVPQGLFAKHPEFFSKIYGKRRQHPSMMCHSAPGILDRAMEYIAEEIVRKPGIDVISFCPSDYGFFCECRKCQAMDDVTKYYDYYVKEPPLGYGGPVFEAHMSERVFGFTNRVADRLAKAHPDKFLTVFAYGAYRFPPVGMKIRDNVIVWLTHTCVGMWNKRRREAEENMLRAWRKVAKHVVIFEAISNQCWPCLPREVSPLVDIQLKLLKKHGIQGYYTQMWGDFSQNLPSFYLAHRLAWNPSLNAGKELAEMYRRGFGPAAKHVAAYYRIMENAWRTKTEDGSLPWSRSVITTKRLYGICTLVFTEQVMAAARAAVEKAREAAGKGIHRQRVEFVEKGLRYTELMLAAIREVVAIEDMNIPLLYTAPFLSPEYPYDYVKALLMGQCDKRIVAYACRRALKAFDNVEAFVRRFDGQYVLGPGIVQRAASKRTRECLQKILKLAEDKQGDAQIIRKMFVTREL